MKLDDYIKSHINEIEKIPMKDIIITSRVHLKGKFERSNQPSEDLIIVVKKMKLQNKYALVVGWHNFIEASERKLEEIKCIVQMDNRWSFRKRNLRRCIDIDMIEIPNSWSTTKPKKQKVQNKINFYNTYGFFKDEIVLDNNGVLIDGYATYISAKKLGINKVPIIQSRQ
jgi:hypothetical protein